METRRSAAQGAYSKTFHSEGKHRHPLTMLDQMMLQQMYVLVYMLKEPHCARIMTGKPVEQLLNCVYVRLTRT